LCKVVATRFCLSGKIEMQQRHRRHCEGYIVIMHGRSPFELLFSLIGIAGGGLFLLALVYVFVSAPDTPAAQVQTSVEPQIAPTAVVPLSMRCQNGVWGLPVRDENYRVTATFGYMPEDSEYAQSMRKAGALVPGARSAMHPGVDLAARVGDPIYAVFSGEVKEVAYSDLYGRHIIVSDGVNDVLFAHLSSTLVRERDQVSCGQLIGLGGRTGTALTGSHLHVELRPAGGTRDDAIDPLDRIVDAYAASPNSAVAQGQ
jgi:murein DD-endopeptidase MepM/ murein hydrolase activator NlpD